MHTRSAAHGYVKANIGADKCANSCADRSTIDCTDVRANFSTNVCDSNIGANECSNGLSFEWGAPPAQTARQSPSAGADV